MDRLNVNLKMLCDLREYLKNDENDSIIFDCGTCGIHLVHNCFKAAHKAPGWNLDKFLRSIY